MHFIIYAKDTPNSQEKRRSVRPAHIQRLQDLKAQNLLLLAGPLMDSDDENQQKANGSVIIADFDNLETAKAWAAADPYVTAEVYANITVQPFKVVL